jgi:hypothetical protein
MMPLTDKQINILRLIQRSKPEEDGSYRVSKVVWPLVNGALPADLVETTPTDDGGFIRFTARGQAVSDYF